MNAGELLWTEGRHREVPEPRHVGEIRRQLEAFFSGSPFTEPLVEDVGKGFDSLAEPRPRRLLRGAGALLVGLVVQAVYQALVLVFVTVLALALIWAVAR